jgi:hypothetical protein
MTIKAELSKVRHLLTNLDFLMSHLLPYIVILAIGGVAAYAYFYGGPKFGSMLEMVGIALGIASVLFIYRQIDQEKSLQFFEGESVILKSESGKSFAMLTAIGDQDLPLEPIRANIYMTNLGILAEKPGTGEATLFIPVDRITDFSPHQQGIRIRFADVGHPYAEAMIFVDDRNAWMQKMWETLNRGRKTY